MAADVRRAPPRRPDRPAHASLATPISAVRRRRTTTRCTSVARPRWHSWTARPGGRHRDRRGGGAWRADVLQRPADDRARRWSILLTRRRGERRRSPAAAARSRPFHAASARPRPRRPRLHDRAPGAGGGDAAGAFATARLRARVERLASRTGGGFFQRARDAGAVRARLRTRSISSRRPRSRNRRVRASRSRFLRLPAVRLGAAAAAARLLRHDRSRRCCRDATGDRSCGRGRGRAARSGPLLWAGPGRVDRDADRGGLMRRGRSRAPRCAGG